MNLYKSYGKKKVLKGISFNVRRGEVFTLIGPNGSGKTTIMEILEGVRTYNSGSFTILGKNTGDREVREKIGVAIQDSHSLSHLRVSELLAMYSKLYTRTLPLEEVIRSVHLTGKERQMVRNLSGGEKQLLNIAVAIVHDPQIVFLDEPSTGLDPEARRRLWSSMGILKEQGKTILLTTHNMEEAELLSDRVAILKDGILRSLGSPEDLLKEAGMNKRIDFEFNESEDGIISILQDRFQLKKGHAGSYSIFTMNVEDDMKYFLSITSSAGISIRSLSIHVPDLEDVYFVCTGGEG